MYVSTTATTIKHFTHRLLPFIMLLGKPYGTGKVKLTCIGQANEPTTTTKLLCSTWIYSFLHAHYVNKHQISSRMFDERLSVWLTLCHCYCCYRCCCYCMDSHWLVVFFLRASVNVSESWVYCVCCAHIHIYYNFIVYHNAIVYSFVLCVRDCSCVLYI